MSANARERRFLIVSPHFPPVNAPDHQRVRMSLPYFTELRWQPTVLAVRPDCLEGCVNDPLLEKTVPKNIEVIRVGAIPFYLTRVLGGGSLALRALLTLHWAGNRLLRSVWESLGIEIWTTLSVRRHDTELCGKTAEHIEIAEAFRRQAPGVGRLLHDHVMSYAP